jgi:hypothetical protein
MAEPEHTRFRMSGGALSAMEMNDLASFHVTCFTSIFLLPVVPTISFTVLDESSPNCSRGVSHRQDDGARH